MKSIIAPKKLLFTILAILCIVLSGFAQEPYLEFRGEVVDVSSNEALVYAQLTVENTSVNTVTNVDGEFLLKITQNQTDKSVLVSFLGYKTKRVPFSTFLKGRKRIELQPILTELSEINLSSTGNARDLVKRAFNNRKGNYLDDATFMTAFYRERIKKRRRNVSLAEAVVSIEKQSYSNRKPDKVALYKARKNTDYSKLDTVALKLQGGPLNALYADFMKYPEYFLSPEDIEFYDFEFGTSTQIDGKALYVVNFKKKDGVEAPSYYGTLFISPESFVITNAEYSLDVSNRDEASKLFVRKKPNDVNVYPKEANYRVDYREKNGQWYYSYSNIYLEFVVDRDGKLFNSRYSLDAEMVITDIVTAQERTIRNRDKFRYSAILVDEASGFFDSDFWGKYNVIEPDKSIQDAIDKIQRRIKNR